MASTQALSAAAQDRKARLAQLKSLKRKQPDTYQEADEEEEAPARHKEETTPAEPDASSTFLSGRNYDSETKGPRLGFEAAPSEGKETLEKKAAALALDVKQQAAEEEKADKPLDLFKLQPKKPHWDLKRDLDRKLDVLNVRTDNAIAKLLRERIAGQQKAAKEKMGGTNGGANGSDGVGGGAEGEAVGMEGAVLVEATHVREREDEEDARREREEEEALLDAS
ncbi:hypothetical protein LTR86_001239 [Recurvomyces mirabilis]|nr:hypothetical protein LTR86_001239 [Recurvomyces mirabilis]